MNLLQRQVRLRDAYRSVFGTVAGRDVLLDLMKKGCVGKSTAQGASSRDALIMNEGARVLVLHIIRQLSKDDAALLGLIENGIEQETESHE